MKRYSIYSGERPSIVEAFDGWWVKWEDAEREVAQLMERVEILEEALEGLLLSSDRRGE